MYSLLKSRTVKELLLTQFPVVIVSLVIAEIFYKFQSFLLETGAFLATWFVLDLGYSAARSAMTYSGKREA